MKLEILLPSCEAVEVTEFAGRLAAARRERAPFAPELMDCFGRYSRAIFQSREASRYPELMALAYWLRPAELSRLKSEFVQALPPDTVVVPRGTVFHVPPSNVDTIFVYSFVLSALTGNTNVIRVSGRSSPQTEILIALLREQLNQDKGLDGLLSVVRYGHEAEITAALSAVCDCRVIWGGDNTVRAIRAAPLPPHAIELTFPDRFSLAAISAPEYLALDAGDRPSVANDFFNDAFWFDQMACSSPRLVVWCGSEADAERASRLFWQSLEAELERRRYVVQPAVSVRRLAFACEVAADRPLTTHEHGRFFTRLRVPDLDRFSREHCGGGAFFETVVDRLDRLIPFIERRDQTVSYFGFAPEMLQDFARALLARGVERIVPLGQALRFSRYWDGYDLLLAFGRFVHVVRPARRRSQ